VLTRTHARTHAHSPATLYAQHPAYRTQSICRRQTPIANLPL